MMWLHDNNPREQRFMNDTYSLNVTSCGIYPDNGINVNVAYNVFGENMVVAIKPVEAPKRIIYLARKGL